MKKTPFLPAILIGAVLLLSSCGPEPPGEENVAVVNGSPISLGEFKKEVSFASQRYPELVADPGSEETLSEVLENMVLKKLMIQEAAKRGLSENERFLDTIKMFWEQTLIKDLIDAKTTEWADRLAVTEDEAALHYSRMKNRLTLLAVREKDKDGAERLAGVMAAGGRPAGAETIGPILIENISPADPLCAAFDLPEGGTGVFREDDGYLAVKAVRKETVRTRPYEAISQEIKRTLLEGKKEQALEQWLDGLKKAASIEINRDALKKVQ
ncbi:MAG: SurA N-terminal domain-containing protein [Thermodesulfobacteriota bacterium]